MHSSSTNTNNVEYITPENLLIKKTGTGGLPQSMIDMAQHAVDSMSINTDAYVKSKILLLKCHTLTDDFVTAGQEKLRDFLHDLVPLHVNIKLEKASLSITLSHDLLYFTERLNTINVDSFNIIRGYINAIEVAITKNIVSTQTDAAQKLITELNNACNRYHTKYSQDL